MSEARFRFLSQEDVVAAGGLDVAATIDVVEEALRLHAEGDTRLPSKSALLWSDELGSEETDGRIMAMPAYVGGSIALAGLKWIPSVPSNPSRGLPRGIGLIVLTDPQTGLPVAVMDGTIVSAVRTGAVTGVTARRLARPGARVAAILGAGVQAATQLSALEAVLPGLEEVRVWDIAPERADAFRERSDAVVPIASAEEACRGADVIVAATMAPEPYVSAEWLGPGSLFCSVSSLDAEVDCVLRADLVVCDLWDHESGHHSRPLARAFAAGLITREDVVELPDLVSGRHPGRTSDDQRIFSTPVGLAIEDVAAAARVYRKAEELGIGTELSLWRDPIWV
ncbi:MAG TPA: ornithine cyclodeaminase family protein [Actinomycetota bacterium]|nr:ornithine cyclodeaminase family protein [Actinomycetota bacterium]